MGPTIFHSIHNRLNRLESIIETDVDIEDTDAYFAAAGILDIEIPDIDSGSDNIAP